MPFLACSLVVPWASRFTPLYSFQVCYVKSLSSTHFLLTILPKTFADLKALLVDDAALEGQNLEALTLVETGPTGTTFALRLPH